jgi:hypothetical protein
LDSMTRRLRFQFGIFTIAPDVDRRISPRAVRETAE